MTDLSTSVRYIKGIGEKKAQALGKLGVFSLYDLLSYFPARYEDRTKFCPIAAAPEGEGVCIRALVADTPRLVRVRRGMELVKFRAVDESGTVDITYFNQNYVKDYLARGDSVCFFGKIERSGGRRSMVNPAYEKEDKPRGVTGCILPVYRVNAALNQRTLRDAVRQGLDACAGQLPEYLPEEIRVRNGLAQARYAFENVHFPPDFEALAIARRRLVFEELFILACALGTLRAERTKESGLKLEKPQIVRQGGKYSVKLKANAPAIHMMMTNIETEVTPAIGGEGASEEIINFLLQGFDGDVNRIWQSNIFGKSLNDIAEEGLTAKIDALPENVKEKMRETLERILNEGSGGLICILL